MKLGLFVLGVFVTSCAVMGFGCVDDTGTNTSASTSGSSSTSSTSSTSSSSSSSGDGGSGGGTAGGGGSGGGAAGGGGTGGSMVYMTCGECTDNTTGAYSKKSECKDEADACSGNPECLAIFECSLQTCTTDKEGGCCTLNCAKGKSQAAQDLFLAMDKCVYCTTCAPFCEGAPVSAKAYCDSINGVTMCP